MSEPVAALSLSSTNVPENPKPKTTRAGVETLSLVSSVIGLADAGTHLGNAATVVEKSINTVATKASVEPTKCGGTNWQDCF